MASNSPVMAPVSWSTARQVASRLAGRRPGLAPWEQAAMSSDFAELTAEAETLVAAETGLRPAGGPARVRVIDRVGWVEANVSSFQRLLRPLTERMAETLAASRGPRLPMSVTAASAGAQLGVMLAWMSGRVLGQYDQLLVEDEWPEDQDWVYFVGPNVAAVERRYGFPPREFRLWLALHEVTHRAQFTAVPWMRDHFTGLVAATLSAVDPDPRRIVEALPRALEHLRAGRSPLGDGGLVALLATPEQEAAIQAVGGLMSLLEGHGDVTMDRAAAERIPNAARFSATLARRRRQRGPARLVSALIGLDAKLRQYEQGERFVRAVEDAGGRPLFDRVWEAPEWLPTWPEIRRPAEWIARATPAGPMG